MDPIRTVRSRYTRGYCDWELQIRSWQRLLRVLPAEPYFLPIDLLSRRNTEGRMEALEGLVKHMQAKSVEDKMILWAQNWPEHRNDEDRTLGLVPDLTLMKDVLRKIPGLVMFLRTQGYDLEWM